MKRKIISTLSSISILMFCIGCNSSGNRSFDLNNHIAKQIDSASSGVLEFKDFKKIDGIDIQDGSQKYKVSFTGFINARQNCTWNGIIITSFLDNSRLSIGEVLPSVDSTNVNYIKRNYGLEVKGEGTLEKRDSGWKIISVHLKYNGK